MAARIGRPSRFVSVVLPVGHHDETDDLCLVSETGERMVAQVDRVASYAYGEPQALELSARFSTAPLAVTVERGVATDAPAFAWVGGVPAALRRALASDTTKPIASGHVKRTWRFVNIDGELSMVVWITAFSGSRCLRYDAVYHNARPGASPLAVPGLWIWGTPEFDFYSTLPEPLHLPGMTSIGQSGEFYFPQRGRRIVRGVLAPKDATPNEIREVSHAFGWGVLVDEWRSTRAFTSMQIPVPDFGTLDLAGRQKAQLASARNALANGTSYPGPNYTHSKRLGLWHPACAREGGETGGLWITVAPGVDVAASGAVAGLELAMCEERMLTDRSHVGLVERNGTPCKLEDYAADRSWRMRSDDGRFDKSGGKVLDGPFGFSTRPPLPIGLCPEQADLDAFEPMDFAHLIRAYRPSVTLAWLSNDPISKWLIRQDAEIVRMAWCNGRLASDEQFSLAHPKRGMHWQRIHGWMCRVMAEAYALHGDRLRARFAPDAARMFEIADRAVMPNGILNTLPSGKEFYAVPYSRLHVPAAQHHHGILTCGLAALGLAVDDNAPKAVFDALKGVRFLLYGKNTLFSAAVRPVDLKAEPYTSRQVGADGLPLDSSHPNYPDGKATALVDSEQTRCIVGMIGLHGEPEDAVEAVQLAFDMCGPLPESALRSMGFQATDSDAVLLAFAQDRNLP